MDRKGSAYLKSILFLATISFGLVSNVKAQVDRATLSGTITDPSGAVVSTAIVTATGVDTGVSRQTSTESDGTYHLPALAVGSYLVTVAKNGFKRAEYTDIKLLVGQNATLDVQLQLGSAATEKVQVIGADPELDEVSPTISGIVGSSEIQELPTNGRNWASYLIFVPGAIDDGGGDQRTIRFVGRGRDDNNYLMDGIDATGIQEKASKSVTRLQISEDAVAEYRVNSMLYSAEYGAGSGGQIDLVTKSGSNNFHGDLFEFFRNSALDARSFLDFPGIPPFRQNQFGGSVGGPIEKDKTFFFASFEALRSVQDLSKVGFVPSAMLREQILATSPQMAPIVNAFPSGNASTTDPNVDEFLHTAHINLRETSWFARIDHTFTDRTSLSFRATRDVASGFGPLGDLLDQQGITNNPSNWMLALDHAFSPTVFNEVKVGINREPFHNPQKSVFPYDVATNDFSELANSNTDNEVGTDFDYIDNLTVKKGRHTFKIGATFERVRLNQGITADPNLSFTDVNSLINDQLSSFSIRTSWWSRGYRRFYVLPYFEDDIKVRSDLTLDLGLRWEYYSVMKEVKDRLTNFDLSCGGVCPPGSPTEFPNYRNFDPRLGVAWAPAMFHHKTVFRAGYGIYSGPGQNDDTNAAFESNDFRISANTDIIPNLSYPIDPFLPLASVVARTPRALERNRHDLYVNSWGFSIQQELPASFMLQTSYMGSEAIDNFERSYINLCTGPIDPNTGSCPRPLPGYGIIDIKNNHGTASFNALQVGLQRRFTKGWLWGTQYMWSHALDDGGVGGGEANAPQNVNCRQCDYGPSIFDVNHNLVVDSVYNLPFGPGQRFLNVSGVAGKVVGGWTMSSIAAFHTGHPLTVVVSRDATAIPDGNSHSDQRPNLLPGMPLIPANQNANQWINETFAADGTPLGPFVVPADGTFGNAGRGLIRSPNVWQIDFALQKTTHLTEKSSLDFRVEAFNIFNHTPLGDPGNLDILGGPSFGQITSTVGYNNNNDNFFAPNTGSGLPRQIEFMLRVNF
jgi:hypothetical protein